MAIRPLIITRDNPEQALTEIQLQWQEMAGVVNDVLNHFKVDRAGQLTSDATKVKHLETNGNPPRGSAAPVQVYLNNTTGWRFDVNDEVYYNLGMPDDWVPGTDITFTLCFYSANTTASRYVSWSLDWQATAYGEAISSPGSSDTIASGDVLLSTTANTLTETVFTAIPGASLAADDHIFLRLVRTTASGTAPTATADDPVMMHFELHYTSYVTADWT